MKPMQVVNYYCGIVAVLFFTFIAIMANVNGQTQEEEPVIVIKYIHDKCVTYYPKVQHYLVFENVSEEECPIGQYLKSEIQLMRER